MARKTKANGICHIAGAGPGDLGLVTLRLRECMQEAEVVVYDSLSNPEILKWAPASAEIVYAGKKAGDHTLPQDEINALLVEKTKAGKRVVRLKGGDPFLFGRGGEEAMALAKAGLKFEVVPGVSSSLAGPAYAGIPVTHRGQSSQVTIFTGHEDPNKPGSALDYKQLACQPGTKVMLMGVERIGKIAEALMENGASPETPIALVRWATTGRQRTVSGTLKTIDALVTRSGFSAPAVAVIGEVVGLRDSLNWYERQPLFGKRIVVTRATKQAGTLADGLRVLGADVFELPTLRIEPPKDIMEFGQLVQDAHMYDWLVFTSVNGVEAFFEMFYKLYSDAREIGGVRIAAVGRATAERIRQFHLKVDMQPEQFLPEALIRELKKTETIENERFLVVRAEVTRDVLAKELTALGAIVDEAIAYRTMPETGDVTGGIARFKEEGADLITFASSSSVENFMALNLQLPPGLKTASIGPITSQTMRDLGLPVDLEAKRHDTEGLIEAIQTFYTAKS